MFSLAGDKGDLFAGGIILRKECKTLGGSVFWGCGGTSVSRGERKLNKRTTRVEGEIEEDRGLSDHARVIRNTDSIMARRKVRKVIKFR